MWDLETFNSKGETLGTCCIKPEWIVGYVPRTGLPGKSTVFVQQMPPLIVDTEILDAKLISSGYKVAPGGN